MIEFDEGRSRFPKRRRFLILASGAFAIAILAFLLWKLNWGLDDPYHLTIFTGPGFDGHLTHVYANGRLVYSGKPDTRGEFTDLADIREKYPHPQTGHVRVGFRRAGLKLRVVVPDENIDQVLPVYYPPPPLLPRQERFVDEHPSSYGLVAIVKNGNELSLHYGPYIIP